MNRLIPIGMLTMAVDCKWYLKFWHLKRIQFFKKRPCLPTLSSIFLIIDSFGLPETCTFIPGCVIGFSKSRLTRFPPLKTLQKYILKKWRHIQLVADSVIGHFRKDFLFGRCSEWQLSKMAVKDPLSILCFAQMTKMVSYKKLTKNIGFYTGYNCKDSVKIK